jgi:hypothetical protein
LHGGGLSELSNANLNISHTNLAYRVFFVSQTFDHDRYKAGKLAYEIVVRGRKMDHNSSESLTNSRGFILSLLNNNFNVLIEVSLSMSGHHFSEALGSSTSFR